MEKIKVIKPKIIRTKKYKTIDIVLIYPIKFQKNHFFDLKIIRNIITSTSKDFPLEQDFRKEVLKKLIINYNIGIERVKHSLFFKVYLTVPNPKEVHDFNLKEAIDFFFKAIYCPNVENDSFKEKDIEREKNFIMSKTKNINKDIYGYSYDAFMKAVDIDFYNDHSSYANLDILDTVTPKSVYKYYLENIINTPPIIFVYGNILKSEVNNLFKDYFIYQEDIELDKDFSYYKKSNLKVNEVIEVKKEYQDSILNMAFLVKNMKDEDEIYLRALNNLITKSLGISLFFKKLRLDNNLVYSVFNSVKLNRGLLVVETSLEKNNKEKVVNLIKETLSELKDKKVLEEYQEKCLKCMRYQEIRRCDEKYSKLDEAIDYYLGISITQKELAKKFKGIDIDKFLKFLNRIELDTIYFLRGEK